MSAAHADGESLTVAQAIDALWDDDDTEAEAEQPAEVEAESKVPVDAETAAEPATSAEEPRAEEPAAVTAEDETEPATDAAAAADAAEAQQVADEEARAAEETASSPADAAEAVADADADADDADSQRSFEPLPPMSPSALIASLRPSASAPALSASYASSIAGSVGHVAQSAQFRESAYRIAAARSTEHREQELAWQWHVYRLKVARPALDNGPPHSMAASRGPEKSRRQLIASKREREIEISLANHALVSRIRSQKSSYAREFADVQSNSPLARAAGKAREQQTSTTGRGASGIYFGSRQNRAEQAKIAAENAKLLRSLQRINKASGPYNAGKIAKDVDAHEALVRHRLPRVMHAHPSLEVRPGEEPLPPISFSIIAARAGSPTKGSATMILQRPSTSGSPKRSATTSAPISPLSAHQQLRWDSPMASAQEQATWNEHDLLAAAAAVPAARSSKRLSTPIARISHSRSRSRSPPRTAHTAPRHQQREEEAKQESRASARPKSSTRASPAKAPGASPATSRASSRPAASHTIPPKAQGKLAPVARPKTTATERTPKREASPYAPVAHLHSASVKAALRAAASTPAAAGGSSHPGDAIDDLLDDNTGLDLNDAAATTVADSDAALSVGSLQSKLDQQLAHKRVQLDGVDATIFVERAESTPADSEPTLLQFTAFPSSPSSLPPSSLLVPIASLAPLFPHSIKTFLAPPYRDFTLLLYAVASRLAMEDGKLALHLQPD